MTQLADVNDFIDVSHDVTTERQLSDALGGIAREMGFDRHSLYRREVAHDRASIALTDYPEDWVARVRQRRYYVDDPAYMASWRTAVGFSSREVGSLLALTTRQRNILQEARKADLGEWFAVPAHVANESRGLATFVVCRGRELPERNLPMAQLVGCFAYEAARRLHRRSEVLAPPPVALTPRQLDCLILVARGKTDWEIGAILGVAEDTIGKYMDDARRRYGVSRRSELVVRALYDGHFSLEDAIR